MLLKFAYTSVANNATYQPAEGYKWILKSLLLKLVTGTGTGTRSLAVYHLESASVQAYSTLASISTTSVSSTVISTSDLASEGVYSVLHGEGVAIHSADEINVQMTIVTGDVVNLYFVVEEVPA